ncbi:MAG: TatD family hydrolase [Candidatus Paceibacterota bacterium]
MSTHKTFGRLLAFTRTMPWTLNGTLIKTKVREEREVFNIDALAAVAKEEKVIAIGECGLDYYREQDYSAEQKLEARRAQRVFRAQADLALSLDKPLMLHVRPSASTDGRGKPTAGSDDAYEKIFEILSEDKYRGLTRILHFYVGGVAMTQRFVDDGYYFTLGGVMTFVRDYDESYKLIPLDRIMLETDAPYVAPAPAPGQRNESSFIVETAKKLAEIKGVSYDEVERQTNENVSRVFNIEL